MIEVLEPLGWDWQWNQYNKWVEFTYPIYYENDPETVHYHKHMVWACDGPMAGLIHPGQASPNQYSFMGEALIAVGELMLKAANDEI